MHSLHMEGHGGGQHNQSDIILLITSLRSWTRIREDLKRPTDVASRMRGGRWFHSGMTSAWEELSDL